MEDFSDLFHASRYLMFFCLAYIRNKLLLCKLTLRWGEMNLKGQFFLVGLPGSKRRVKREESTVCLLEFGRVSSQ